MRVSSSLFLVVAVCITTLLSQRTPTSIMCHRMSDSHSVCNVHNSSAIIDCRALNVSSHIALIYILTNKGVIAKNVFIHCDSLTDLLLSGMHIYSLDEQAFTGLPSLTTLAIVRTAVNSLPDTIFRNLTELKHLDLSSNEMQVFPTNTFHYLKGLQSLDLSHNPRNWTKIIRLKGQMGNSSLISGNKLEYAFSHLINLQTLILSNISHSIQDEQEVEIYNDFMDSVSRTLEQLDISYNRFHMMQSSAFLSKFSKLKVLDLSAIKYFSLCPGNAEQLFNRLPKALKKFQARWWKQPNHASAFCSVSRKTITGLANLQHLTDLDLSHSEGIFGNFMDDDIFTYSPDQVVYYNKQRRFPKLVNLDLSDCGLAFIYSGAFNDQLETLRHLNLAGNPLGSHCHEIISYTNAAHQYRSPGLHFNLSRTVLYNSETAPFLIDPFLLSVPHTTHLDLSHNFLQIFPFSSATDCNQICRNNCPKSNNTYDFIELLNVDYNYLESIEARVCDLLPKIWHLSIKTNSLSLVQGLASCNLTLRVLEVDNNKLGVRWEDNSPVLSRLTALQQLSLSQNQLSRIGNTFTQLASLKTLNLARNSISVIEADAFKHCIKLETLSLDSNALSTIDFVSVSLESLKILSIKDNKLSVIDDTLALKLSASSLESLNIGQNPFACDCNHQWMQDWLLKNKFISQVETLRCSSPIGQQNEPVVSYQVDIFECNIKQPLIIVMSTVVSCIAALALALPCYKYRWYIRNLKQVLSIIADDIKTLHWEDNCLYDAFISYNTESETDSLWVTQELLPNLDKEFTDKGFKVYVTDRDSVPGSLRHAEACNALNESRKVIIVLSNSYLDNNNCLGEASLIGAKISFAQPIRLLTIVMQSLSSPAQLNLPIRFFLTGKVIQWPQSHGIWSEVANFLRARTLQLRDNK